MNSPAFILSIPNFISTTLFPFNNGELYNSHIGAVSTNAGVVNGFIFTLAPAPGPPVTISTYKATYSPTVQFPLKYRSISVSGVR